MTRNRKSFRKRKSDLDMDTITQRRSIRKFKPQAVSKEQLAAVINSGILAPSSKNRQPWRFVVVTGNSKENALAAMERGLEREKRCPFLPDSADFLSDAENTLKVMRQAPAVIFVVNTLGTDLRKPLSADERVYEICNTQSIGAAIENMSLKAVELGLGSLWICNTFFAFEELSEFLNMEGALFAALAVGYPDEDPSPRPRRSIEEVTEWRD